MVGCGERPQWPELEIRVRPMAAALEASLTAAKLGAIDPHTSAVLAACAPLEPKVGFYEAVIKKP